MLLKNKAFAKFNDDEQELIKKLLKRDPTDVECALIKALWSEHCSYKSSKNCLKRLPNEASWVLCGEGENAGAVDVGDGLACVFKIESHNHPSFIEPYQGAATAVGGILRDIFAMGARPKALMNVLAFGEPSHARTRYLLREVVRGIGDYGNCVGVPTVGGECRFDASYNGNIIVNALAAGIVPHDGLASAAAPSGSLLMYAGSTTGRDGIAGAEMASRSFQQNAITDDRPSVQGGDPFAGRQIMQASLAIINRRLALAVQDMGAAGLTSSVFEMAAKGEVSLHLQLDRIPLRISHLTSHDIMLSESQERMLFAIEPAKQKAVETILNEWQLSHAVIGQFNEGHRITATMNGKPVFDLPTTIVSQAPVYDRPQKDIKPPPSMPRNHHLIVKDDHHLIQQNLTSILGSHHAASRRWIFEQYDCHVMTDTVQASGGDAAIIRIHDNGRAIALACDSHPRATALHPMHGTALAASECYRNLCAVGAKPLAFTNNLNFGNPEDPHIMSQLAQSIEGLRDAALALDCPVVSGNVSLYNETDRHAIMPTPVIGGLAVMKDMTQHAHLKNLKQEDQIFLIGESRGELGASLYCHCHHLARDFAPPEPRFDEEKKHGTFVRHMIEQNITHCVHDVSDGGWIMAICDMICASGQGVRLHRKAHLAEISLTAWLFCESPARYIIATAKPQALQEQAQKHAIPLVPLGVVEGDTLSMQGVFDCPVTELIRLYSQWFDDYIDGREMP